MNQFQSRSLVILMAIVAISINWQLVLCQLPTLNYRPKHLKESVIIRKAISKDICSLKDLDGVYYFCEPLENFNNAAYLQISCETVSKVDSPFLILGNCSNHTDLNGDLASLKDCAKYVCDEETSNLNLLIIKVSSKAEYFNAIQHFNRDFRFKESIRKMKLSPTPVHLLYKKVSIFTDLALKSTPWTSPFYGKYIVYDIGNEEHIPTLDWTLQKFENHHFNNLLELLDNDDIGYRENTAISIFDTVFSISWIISTIMEIYWTRGIDQSKSTKSQSNQTQVSPFDQGLSYRTYCSLNFSSFVFNMKQYIDFVVHVNMQTDSDTQIKDLTDENIKEIFLASKVDLDSFFLTYSPNEINTEHSDLTQEELFNKPFPCMSKFKSHQKLKKSAFDDYSSLNVKKEPNSDTSKLSKSVNEDILVLIHIIHELISKYIIAVYNKNPNLTQSSEILARYYKHYQRIFSRITELKSEVDRVCGRRAFKAYSKNVQGKKTSISSSNKHNESSTSKYDDLKDEPVCSLRYSMEVVKRIEAIFFSLNEQYKYYDQYRRLQLNSPEYLIRSTYCFSKSLYKNNYKDVPSETIISAVLANSIIYKSQNDTQKSLKSECLQELRNGGLSWLVDLESNSQICESFTSCMFDQKSLITSIEIFAKLAQIDQEGGFHEKSALIKEMCIYSDNILGLNLAKTGDKESSGNSNFTNCQGFRLLQLSLRTSQLQQDAISYKSRVNLIDKNGMSYFIPDSSTVSYLLINDFCMDPEITSLIQCNFDWEAFQTLEDLRKSGKGDNYERITNSIVLQDGYTIFTPLYFKENTDIDFISLSNGVLFARILDIEKNPDLRLTYFNGLPFPYHMGNDDLKRKICEKNPGEFTYNPKSSNPQMILVLKLSYISSPVSLIVDDDYFDNKALIRNSRIFKEKFSVIDVPGLSVPLTPSIIQIESTPRSGSACNSILFPYLMIQEFVNPLNLDPKEENTLTMDKKSSPTPRSKIRVNTMDDITYPTDLEGVVNSIANVEPLALNFIVTGRGRKFLKMILKSNYYIGYHYLTTLLSFWTGGTRFRQHCDMHLANILTRFPSSWKKYKWEKYLTSVLNHIDQRYFTIIDVDYSYESEMKITNLEEDIERLPDKNPCNHPSVTENNNQVSRNDYERIMDFFCEILMSLEALSDTISDIYPSKSVYHDLSLNYGDIMSIHNYTLNFCEEAKNMIKDLKDKQEDDLAVGFKMTQDLRRTLWNSIMSLEQIETDNDDEIQGRDLFNRFLYSGLKLWSDPESQVESGPVVGAGSKLDKNKGSKNLRRIDSSGGGNSGKGSPKEGVSELAVEKGSLQNFSERVMPSMFSSIPDQSLSFYCTAMSVRELLDIPSLKFTDLLNFLLQRSSLEGYIRQTHIGSSFEDFEPTRNKLENVEHLRLECMQKAENKNIVMELMPLLYSDPDIICPKSFCKSVKHYDIFESLVAVYRFHLNYLVSTAYYLRETFTEIEDRMLNIKVWMVEREENSGRSEKKMLNLRLEQINSLIELYHFCIRDRFYASLAYGQVKCKTIEDFDENGKDSNGLLLLEFSSKSDNSSSFILFPWIYNSDFSKFESEFPFKEISGVSVIGIVEPFDSKAENKGREVFIHKGNKCIYNFNSRIYEYKAPPSVLNRVSETSESLYRNSFNGYEKMEMNNLLVFTIDDNKISFYDWLRRILNSTQETGGKLEADLERVKFSSILDIYRREIIILTGLIVRTFKSIWIPNPECKHYSKFKTVCFPMFCGMSSKNIILRVGENNRIKGIKFLFGQDIKILNAYNEVSGFNSESHRISSSNSSNSSSDLEDLTSLSHVLPNSCSGNNDEANDMITVASTLDYLVSVIATDSPLEPLKLFSSNINDIYYRYYRMTLEEIIGQVNKFCELLKTYSESKNRIC